MVGFLSAISDETSQESQLSMKKGEPAALKPVFADGNRTEFGVTLIEWFVILYDKDLFLH